MGVARGLILLGVIVTTCSLFGCGVVVASSESATTTTLGNHVRRGRGQSTFHDHRDLQTTVGGAGSFDLIDAITNSKLVTLTNNQVIAVNSITPGGGVSTPYFNLEANVVGTNIQSVVFTSTTTSPNYKVENYPRWAYCGNIDTDFFVCSGLGYGAHTITATPYDAPNGGGNPAGPAISITFTIVMDTPAPPTNIPVKPPTIAPVKPPTNAPVKIPTNAPVKPPTNAPVKPPTNAPINQPANAPINEPANAPVNECNNPELAGTSWSGGTPYPFNVAEAQGMMIGNTFVVYGGFYTGWTAATATTHTLDVSNPSAVWQRVDDLPIAVGLTHGAHVHIGTKIYNCGGYLGGHPGLHTSTCMVYDQSQPLGQRWSTMAPMPDGRAGGGLFYNSVQNSMYYVSGAQRTVVAAVITSTVDFNTTWRYDFDLPGDGWVRQADLPFASNHLMAVTARDASGQERHYAMGGQAGENECCGNYAYLYEYESQNNVWVQRSSMPYGRAHASSSTIPFGCGFIVVGGNSNGGLILSNVSYYSIATDTWIELGNLPFSGNTPVCDIHYSGNSAVLHCETGSLYESRSYKRELLF